MRYLFRPLISLYAIGWFLGSCIRSSCCPCELLGAESSGTLLPSHLAECMGFTCNKYMVSISSKLRSLVSIRKKNTTNTRTKQQPAKTNPYQ